MDDVEVELVASDYPDWAPILGVWERDENSARYIGPPDPDPAVGVLIAPDAYSLGAGEITVAVQMPEDPAEEEPQARIVFGFDSASQSLFSAGLGGYNALYVAEELRPDRGWSPLRAVGKSANLVRGRRYELRLHLYGQNITLDVDGTEVMTLPLPPPLSGSQIGFTAWGRSEVVFSDFTVRRIPPRAFVVMQFDEPYNTLYTEVIAPVSESVGFAPYRADDFTGPGIILQDIVDGIRNAAVVIAEITPVNPNVFYELGYAHATGKPTILLAEKGQKLPFDVSGFRCIFYDDSIGGKRRVESELTRHLEAIF